MTAKSKSVPSIQRLIRLTTLIVITGIAQTTWAGGTCTVPGDYATIQAAVDGQACVDIQLLDQTYSEPLTIDRTLSITGGAGGNSQVLGQVNVTGAFVVAMLNDFRIEGGCGNGTLRVTDGAQMKGSGMSVVYSSGGSCTGPLTFQDGFESPP